MLATVISEWRELGEPGKYRVARRALKKALKWLYSQAKLPQPSFVAVLGSPLGAHMAAELLAARACGRQAETDWAEAQRIERGRWRDDYVVRWDELHLRRLSPDMVDSVLHRTERDLAAQGGGGDWSAVIRRLTERLGEATVRTNPLGRSDRYVDGNNLNKCWAHDGASWHEHSPLSEVFAKRVRELVGRCDPAQQQQYREFFRWNVDHGLKEWSRLSDMDSRGPYWAATIRGRLQTETPCPDRQDHSFLELFVGTWHASLVSTAAAADFMVRTGALNDPFVSGWLDLLKVGFWGVLGLETCAFVVRRPLRALRDQRGRLHCDSGPALTWADGCADYFLQGVSVPEQVVMRPDSLTTEQVLAEPVLEVRRLMVERMGWRPFVSSAQVMDGDSDDSGLPRWLLQFADPTGGEEPVRLLQVTCPSTHREHFLRVPPATLSCTEAVAWTFGLKASGFRPVVET